MKRIIILLLSTFFITACDSDTFNEIFRNPHIVEIAKIESMEADKWYEFDTHLEAINREQTITVSFDGSDPKSLDFSVIENKSVFKSEKFPGKIIDIDIIATSSSNIEYEFKPSGRSNSIYFIPRKDKINKGEVITKVRIKGNLNYRNVNMEWMSRTGK